jgi:Tol biopolymer transport system component
MYRRLIVLALLGQVQAIAQRSEPRSIWRIEILSPGAAVGVPQRLISSPQGDWNPHYTPDGKRIVFESLRGPTRQNWVADGNGSNLFQLTNVEGMLAGTPRWSWDGAMVAFDATDGEIRVVPGSGGMARNVTENRARDVVPSWSRDGRWVYFASNRSGRWEVWKTPRDGGRAVQVTLAGGYVAYESPDGQWLYYTKDGIESPLYRMPVAGGAESAVAPSVLFRAFGVTRRGVYFFGRPEGEGTVDLRYLDLGSGQIRSLRSLSGRLHNGFSVTQDEQFIIYSRVGQ